MKEQVVTPPSSASVLKKHEYPRISIVIPARNEAQNLGHVLPLIPLSVHEVILVDGHSADNTIEEALKLMPDIRIIHQSGRGKGDALRTGFAACTGDIIVMLDADGSADPAEIPRFVEALIQGHDFAKGSRFLAGGGSTDITHIRRWGNACLNTCVNVLFGTRFSDLCYGYNAFWKRCLEEVVVDCDGFEIETQLNLRMHGANMNIVEVPSFEHERIHGQSNLNAFRDGWRVLKTIIDERTNRRQVVRAKEIPSRLSEARPTFSYHLFHSLHRFDISIDISIKKRAAIEKETAI